MQNPKMWRDILKDVIRDPKERQRVAEQLQEHPIILSPGVHSKSDSQRANIIFLVRSISSAYRYQFVKSLVKNKIISSEEADEVLAVVSVLEGKPIDAYIIYEVLTRKDESAVNYLRTISAIYRSKSLEESVEEAAEAYMKLVNRRKREIPKTRPIFPATNKPYQLLHQQEEPTVFSFRIDQEPLNVHNLTTILSSLSELATKYWLISKGRFADLIEYTQTHNPSFEEEANIEITKITYNSPMNMDWKFDVSATNVAEALITTVDGITQVGKRLRKAELEILEKEQALKEAQQKADQAEKTSELEREKQQLEIEKQRLELQKQTLEIQVQQLEFQKKSFEYAIEMATKVVDTLRPGLDPDTRAMAVQAVLPNWIQLQNSKGLELVLPAVPLTTKPVEDDKS